MKRTLLLLALLVAAAFIPVTAQQRDQLLTNQSVIKLVKAGFREKTVIAIIRSRPSRFDLSPDRLIEMKRAGVGEQIILAMLSHEGEFTVAEDDDLENDPFFRSAGKPSTGASPGGSGGSSMDIFGSSSGSRARTSTNGPDGSSSGETDTTGSVTARILRPPTEEGVAPKMEKTPTLTDDSIIDLVDAGFSEGTIIRRIEQSPADFDLSAAKVAELRRRRVSDRVIVAMNVAMGGTGFPDGSTGKTPAGSGTQQD
jgi:hypothetical protein